MHLRLEAPIIAALADIPGVSTVCSAGGVAAALESAGALPLVAVIYEGESAETSAGRAQQVVQRWSVLVAVRPVDALQDGSGARAEGSAIMSQVLERLNHTRLDEAQTSALQYLGTAARFYADGGAQFVMQFEASVLLT